MAGKNKIITGVRLYVGGYNISNDVNGLGPLDYSVGEVELTGWGESHKSFLGDGQFAVGIRGIQAHLNDTTGQSLTALQSRPAASAATVAIGSGGAAPAAADLAYILPPIQISDPSSFSARAGQISGDLLADTSQVDANYKRPLGVVLYPLTSISATTDGTIVDLGAAGAAGCAANLHITATSSGDFAFTIEDSATGAWGGEETALLTFAADGSAIGSEFKTAAGAVLQYVRFVATRTAGTVSVFCALAVN